ncbi:hypothetical protein [Parendozoicomonas sp. Alg238-R29]|uniref:hypothetical protein n=1 Tax=Parendozoicomonas sp. Alg238-R29 TaxID=2993446 RepID=UPI00248F010D|nr:hypothetical protein [Parendozoicomonas sp. Alg238-R29]
MAVPQEFKDILQTTMLASEGTPKTPSNEFFRSLIQLSDQRQVYGDELDEDESGDQASLLNTWDFKKEHDTELKTLMSHTPSMGASDTDKQTHQDAVTAMKQDHLNSQNEAFWAAMKTITDENPALQRRLEDFISQNSMYPVYINLHVPHSANGFTHPSMFECMINSPKQLELQSGNGIYIGEIQRFNDIIHLTTTTSYNKVSVDRKQQIGKSPTGIPAKDYDASTRDREAYVKKHSRHGHADISWRITSNIAELKLQYVLRAAPHGQWKVLFVSVDYDLNLPELTLTPREKFKDYIPPHKNERPPVIEEKSDSATALTTPIEEMHLFQEEDQAESPQESEDIAAARFRDRHQTWSKFARQTRKKSAASHKVKSSPDAQFDEELEL